MGVRSSSHAPQQKAQSAQQSCGRTRRDASSLEIQAGHVAPTIFQPSTANVHATRSSGAVALALLALDPSSWAIAGPSGLTPTQVSPQMAAPSGRWDHQARVQAGLDSEVRRCGDSASRLLHRWPDTVVDQRSRGRGEVTGSGSSSSYIGCSRATPTSHQTSPSRLSPTCQRRFARRLSQVSVASMHHGCC